MNLYEFNDFDKMMVLIYITTSDEEEALNIGKIMVKKRLAACSNIIKDMKSNYWWNNKLEDDNEAILILKTLEKNVDEIIGRVKEIHSYENPCIIALPVIKTSDSYLKWLEEEIS